MVKSIPTFQLKVTEGMIDIDTSVDKLFCYCIEATKGPVLEPILVASQAEAKRIFGVDFAPHFYQKPTGLLIIRVEFEGMSKASLTYDAYPLAEGAVNESGTPFKVIKIESVDKGAIDYTVNISPSLTSEGFNLSIKIGDITSKSYQGLSDIKSVAKQINTKFSQYLKATILATESQLENFKKDQLIIKTSPNDKLAGGSNGYLLKTDKTQSTIEIGANGVFPATTGSGANGKYVDEDPNPQTTLREAYKKAFRKSKEKDVVGIATLSDQEIVQTELIKHINEVTDPEVAQLRFGITGYLDYKSKKENNQPISVSDVYKKAEEFNNEYIIYIGQGVIFVDDKGNEKKLYPHECVQLYTGIRSSLGYSEAIFGGEKKKVLAGVKDTLPVITNKAIIEREDIEELNEHGVCTFKKEYDEVTFLEGVTTSQDHDVLSHESIMSIVLYVTKRLIRIAKPYQGQNLNEDLKSSLQTALSNELKSIVEVDGTLVALDDYNIPPYDVSVKSAAITTFNEAGELIRESKIIIQCRIVPIGALRDIDLGVIVI